MRICFAKLALLSLIALMIGAPAFAQGASSSSSLSGTVVDSSGGIIPGADVVVKNDATGTTFTAVTSDRGTFNIPAIDSGTYTVTVKLMGFKTAVVKDVKMTAGVPVGIKTTLEVGGLEETVVVTGASEIVQTQSAAVSSTMVVEQVSRLPLASRDTLHSVTALPGVMTVAGNSARNSTINGLPSTAINITLDGVNVQDNFNRNGDGFFAYVNPRLDSIEEVTVSTSTPGAESAGQGSVQVRFVTRGGTNTLSGSIFDTYRTWKWATPYWFNQWTVAREPDGSVYRDRVVVNEPGFRLGGPISIPKLFDGRDKAFFFVTYEDFRVPSATTRTRVLMTPLAQTGVFTKADGSTVNLLALAAAAGQRSSLDPTMAALLAQMRTAADAAGKYDARDANTQNLNFTSSAKQFRKYPAARFDYNLAKNHRLTAIGRYQTFDSSPDLLNNADAAIPGLPYGVGGQSSYRYSYTMSVRSVLTKNMVNEIRYGRSGGTTYFFKEQKDQSMWSGTNGFAIDFGSVVGGTANALGLAAPYSANFYQTRYGPTTQLEDTLNWSKGRHTIALGFAYSRIGMNNFDWNFPVPGITLGVDSADPATSFLAAAFGSGTSDYNRAAQLYAALTGRVLQISDNVYRDAKSGKYVYGGLLNQEASQDIWGVFWQDSLKIRSNVTVTAGLRYELQLPFKALNQLYSQVPVYGDIFGASGAGNLFMPGTLTGVKTSLVQYVSGGAAYKTDANNFAPSVGLVWRPSLKNSVFRSLLSDAPVLRGGYSISYNRFATAVFTGVFGSNPGPILAGTRSTGNANLNQDGLGMPVLLSQTARLGAPAFPAAPTFPIYGTYGDAPRVFDPNIQTAPTHSWSVGFQRQLGKHAGIDIRYVGNRTVGIWTLTDINVEKAIVENGFMREFRLAQANLQANIAAGRGNNMKYYGSGTGTSPLPILMAYFTGQPTSAAADPNLYTGASWASSTYITPLATFQPNVAGMANSLQANLRANALSAGLPANFMQANPDYSGARIEKNGGNSRYNGLQIELRRRMANGFLLQGSYVFSRSYTWAQPTLRHGLDGGFDNNVLQSGGLGGVDHAFKVDWVYELPFGRGKTWGKDVNGWINAIIGGWEFDGNARFQSGLIVSFGNRRLVGMTDKQLQDIYKVYHVWDSAANRDRVYMLPQDFIQNTINAYATSATSTTGYSGALPTGAYFAPPDGPDCLQAYAGQCAPLNHFVRGPWFARADLSVVKKIHLPKRMSAEIRLDILNALNIINFVPIGFGSTTTLASWQVTAAYRDNNQQQDPGGRLLQLVTRFSW